MLHTRQELINWIHQNVTDPVIQHLLEWGRVENLGGFDPLPTSKNPGWVVKITSRSGRVWFVAVGVKNYQLYWFRLKEVDWGNWVGENAKNELYRGDKR
jgi:hypothetical protein